MNFVDLYCLIIDFGDFYTKVVVELLGYFIVLRVFPILDLKSIISCF